jgi:hypothetical protein
MCAAPDETITIAQARGPVLGATSRLAFGLSTMGAVAIDAATGDLLVAGRRVFPIGLSDPPPRLGTAPASGLPAWAEIAGAGVNFVRNYTVFTAAVVEEQLLAVRQELDAAEAEGLQVWLALAGIDRDLSKRQLFDQVVNDLKGHGGLGVWKGVDEPALGRVPVEGCVGVYRRLRALDPAHPVAIIEAPRAPASTPGQTLPLSEAAVRPYARACDIHGVDIYPVSIPPGAHAGGPPVNTDISVVGDMTRILARATGRRAIWTTLQIAWSGVFPPHPVVFPTLQQARFMAYDAIIAGARGLFLFGGQFKQVMTPADRKRGWNWTYWDRVQRPLLVELTDTAHTTALLAPPATQPVAASAPDIALSTRQAGGVFHLIAVRRSPTGSETVRFTSLPPSATHGTVLEHPGNPARTITATHGAFRDPAPFGPHHARVYRFTTPA